MIVFLNGAFGVGKSSVAFRIAKLEPRFRVVDPERVGWVLSRAALGASRDFQELRAWRTGTRWQIALASRGGRSALVPMAFSDLATMDEIAIPLERIATVQRVCLVAPLETIRARLDARGLCDERGRAWAWRRSAECVAAHCDERFGTPIDTEGASIDEVARRVLDSVGTNFTRA